MCFKLFRGLLLGKAVPLIWPGIFFETLVLKVSQNELLPKIEYLFQLLLFEFNFKVGK